MSDTSEIAAVGIVGLGVMGRNLALNLRERGFTVAGLDAAEPAAAARAQGIATVASLPELVTRTRRPRQLLVMLPAGPAVDSLLSDLAPWLDPGDVVLDGGNSHYKDTIRRAQTMERRGFGFIGLGVSGGAAGARHGPALMAGGSAAAWDCVAPALRAIAARFADEPCAGRIGPDGAGHFVKTVHNGIEYALMQLLAESYDLLRRGASLPPEAVAAAVEGWSRRSLASYLVEITADILRTPAEEGGLLLDRVVDAAEQKGTGAWASIAALEYGIACPTIAEAALARAVSAGRADRQALARDWPERGRGTAAAEVTPELLEAALLTSFIAVFIQGFELIGGAAAAHGWAVERAAVARLWRAGCIVRARLLDELVPALERAHPERLLLADAALRARLSAGMPALRATVMAGARGGIPVPAFASALAWLDGSATARLPADLIQAQRDRFGAHGFDRLDRPGRHHHAWAGSARR